jgi:cysteine synthase A
MANIYENITETVGKTPLVKLNKLTEGLKGTVLVKLESFNPLSSVKDRIALNMINVAEKSGTLKPGMTIVEPTSGNTGIGLAFVGASKGYKVVLTMPDTMSIERRRLLQALGAELVLTPGEKGMKGAINKADELLKAHKGYFLPQQFQNPANPGVHKATTAVEIWEDTDGKFDAFVAGVGTGGTLTGVGEFLKEKKADVRIVAVEPDSSAVLSGGDPGPHKIQGIGAGFIPKVLNTDIYDEVVKITNEEAFTTAKKLAQLEGILVGISSGSNVCAALKLLERDEFKGKTIVTLAPDTGERYLSTALFEL